MPKAKCKKCGKPLPSIHESRAGEDLLCFECFLITDKGQELLAQPYEPPTPQDTGAGGPGRYIDQLHIHHSASDAGNAASFGHYHSVILGWGEIAYNLIVCNGNGGGDGEVQFGKPDSSYPYSVGVDALNRRALAICFVGKFSPGKHPSPAQWRNGVAACRDWVHLYPTITPDTTGGHRQFNNNSACPGFEDSAIARMVADIFTPAAPQPSQPQEDEMLMMIMPLAGGVHPGGKEVYRTFTDGSFEKAWVFVGLSHYDDTTPLTGAVYIIDAAGNALWQQGFTLHDKANYAHLELPKGVTGWLQVDYDTPRRGEAPFYRSVRR